MRHLKDCASPVRMNRQLLRSASTAALLVLSMAPAIAQQVAASANADAVESVVVTGTLIRGIAPVGTTVIGVSNEDIQAVGLPAGKDLLAEVPQVANFFNRIPATGADFGNININPGLRGLGGGTTLFMIDGHRMAPYGAISDVPDADIIPTFALERVEIVPDGGSSIYGSDGVAGVINYITKRHFDGASAEGHYGVADNYAQWDVSGAVGKSWGNFSGYLAYSHSEHSALFNFNRAYARAYSANLSRTCAPGNITVAGVVYSAATFQPGVNTCDAGLNQSLYPAEDRNSFFAKANYDGKGFTVELNGYYTHRNGYFYKNQLGETSGIITNANPFFHSINGETQQTVNFSYASVLGVNSRNNDYINEYGVNPSATVDLGADWKLRLEAYAGHSDTTNHNPQINVAVEQAALASTNKANALNPYDLTQSNRQIIGAIAAGEQFAHSDQKLVNLRGVVDGSLFELPGGSVRVAAGSEYIFQRYDSHAALNIAAFDYNYSNPGFLHGVGSRTVAAVFGEVVVPIFSDGNAIPGFQQLTVSVSGRYDDYDSFGGVFNPKVGLTWEPIHSVKLRGQYAKAFNAPVLADVFAADTRSSQVTAGTFNLLYPGDSATNLTRPLIILAGGGPNLKPQTARVWTIGADITPDFLPGFLLSTTYYDVDIKNQVSILFPANDPNYYTDFNGILVLRNPTLAQAQAFTAGIPALAYDLAGLYAAGNPPYATADFRRRNYGIVEQRGLDFNVTYTTDTDLGAITGTLGGTFLAHKWQKALPSLAATDVIHPNTSVLNFSASVGDTIGDFSARATLLHSQGYNVNNLLNQTHVDSFNVVNLYGSYSLHGGLLEDTDITLNIDNVFDASPPQANNAAGFVNGSTLGRLFQFGFRKKF